MEASSLAWTFLADSSCRHRVARVVFQPSFSKSAEEESRSAVSTCADVMDVGSRGGRRSLKKGCFGVEFRCASGNKGSTLSRVFWVRSVCSTDQNGGDVSAIYVVTDRNRNTPGWIRYAPEELVRAQSGTISSARGGYFFSKSSIGEIQAGIRTGRGSVVTISLRVLVDRVRAVGLLVERLLGV